RRSLFGEARIGRLNGAFGAMGRRVEFDVRVVRGGDHELKTLGVEPCGGLVEGAHRCPPRGTATAGLSCLGDAARQFCPGKRITTGFFFGSPDLHTPSLRSGTHTTQYSNC